MHDIRMHSVDICRGRPATSIVTFDAESEKMKAEAGQTSASEKMAARYDALGNCKHACILRKSKSTFCKLSRNLLEDTPP